MDISDFSDDFGIPNADVRVTVGTTRIHVQDGFLHDVPRTCKKSLEYLANREHSSFKLKRSRRGGNHSNRYANTNTHSSSSQILATTKPVVSPHYETRAARPLPWLFSRIHL